MTVGKIPVRYIRLWWRFATLALVRELEFRLNFAISVAEGLAQLGIAVALALLIYQFAGEVFGWSAAELLLLVGIYRVVEGLINMLLVPNLRAIPGYVRTGELDFALLRPVSSQYYVSLRWLSLHEAVNVVTGLGLAIYAAGRAGVTAGPTELLAAFVLLASGVALLYAAWFAATMLAFWLVRVDNVGDVFYTLLDAGRYPLAFFPGPLRVLLTFVVPVGVATTFPAESLLGRSDPRLVAIAAVMAVVALLGTGWLWRVSLRWYTGASG